jgi:hypothetical protein
MSFHVRIQHGGFQHPPFPYPNREAALTKIEDSLMQSVFSFQAPGTGGNISIQLGAGTIISAVSDEAMKRKAEEAEKKRRNPLLAVEESDAPWKLVVQLGNLQLAPLDVPSEEAAEALIGEAIETGVFRHVLEVDHDYLFVQTGPGTVYMGLPAEAFVAQQRGAVEAAMRQVAKPLPDGQGGPRIITPGGFGRRN